MASGLTESRELPVKEQISSITGDGGSCQHCYASDCIWQRHGGFPYLVATVTDEGLFVAQYGHIIFPSLDASRISPFFSEAPSLSQGWLFGCWSVTGICLANVQSPMPGKGCSKAPLSYAISFSCSHAVNIFFFRALRPDVYS